MINICPKWETCTVVSCPHRKLHEKRADCQNPAPYSDDCQLATDEEIEQLEEE